MTQTISYSDYHTEIDSIAEEIRERQLEEGPGSCFDEHQAVHETVDGHEYVIYTHLAQQVLQHSSNDCAIFEDLGPQEWDDWSTAFTQGACFAMMQDVYEALAELGDPTWECKCCGSDLDDRWDDLDEMVCLDCEDAPEEA